MDPTIAKIACQYDLNTIFSANWPLLKNNVLHKTLKEYKENPKSFNLNKYENPEDKDSTSEPLPLAYKEVFLAVEKGCKTEYGNLTENKLKELLISGYLIQISIKLHLMYPGSKHSLHSILIYRIDGNKIHYHDPHRGEALSCSLQHLLEAMTDVGAFIAYKRH